MIPDAIRLPVPCSTVFPFGLLCLSVDPLPEYAAGGTDGPRPQAHDETSGLPLWVVRVTDLDPEAARPGRTSELRVTIAAVAPPAMPARSAEHVPAHVVFEGLTLTPYVDPSRCLGSSTRCRARLGFRLHAEAMRPASADTTPTDEEGMQP